MEALATIREYKAEALAGTSFMAIPHNALSSEMVPDHSILVKTRPKSAIRWMDRYRKLVGLMFNTLKVIEEDRNPMLKKATETPRVEHISRPRYSPTPEPVHYPVIPPTDTGESHADSAEPSVPEQDNSDRLFCSKSPIENSDGWEYDYYTGTWEHPIPVYDSAGDGDQN